MATNNTILSHQLGIDRRRLLLQWQASTMTFEQVRGAMDSAREDEATAFLEWYWSFDMDEQDQLLEGIPDGQEADALYKYWKSITSNTQI